MMKSTTRRLGILALLATIAAGSAAAVAIAQRDADNGRRTLTVPPRVGEPGTVHTPPAEASAQIKQRLGVFRRSTRSGDRPAGVDAGFARSNGINLSEARRVSTDTFAAPGEGVTCVLDSIGAAACTPDAAIGKDFLTQVCGRVAAGAVAVTGLVPDGTSAVTIRLKNGGVVNASVTANYLDARVSVTADGEQPTAVEYGGQVFPVPDTPMDALDCEG